MKMKWAYAQAAVASLTASALLVSGCGNGILGNANAISSSAASTLTQTLITDAPADQVLALSLTVQSVVLTNSAGKTATVLSTPVQIEASHLNGVHEPLLPPLKIPQDTYVSATITVSDPTVVYVDPTTHKPVKTAAVLSGATTTVTFTTPITVGANAAPICFDLLVGQSVAISGTTVTVTPTFNITQIPLASQPTNNKNGKVKDVVGQVVSTASNSLVVQTPNGQKLTIATDSNTQLQGFTSLSGLAAGAFVDIDLAQQTSGSLLAVRISLLAPASLNVLVGPVASTAGSPVTSFTQVVHRAVGSATASAVGATYTVTTSGSTVYDLSPQSSPLPSLPFTAVFSAATLFAGQNVAVVASSTSGTAVTASNVVLVPQTVSGTIASISNAGGFTVYTLSLPAQAALASLSGASTVTVYVSNNTQMMNAATLAVGSQVRFNGLLFNDKGTLRLVAGDCDDIPTNAPPQKHQ